MITYLLIHFDKIPDTWEPSSVWYLFGFDVLFETFVLANIIFAVRVWLA